MQFPDNTPVIVVMTQSFVACGNLVNTDSGIVLNNAAIIRQWGTTEGLGQLALKGKTSSTILDYYGIMHIPLHSIVFILECTQSLL